MDFWSKLIIIFVCCIVTHFMWGDRPIPGQSKNPNHIRNQRQAATYNINTGATVTPKAYYDAFTLYYDGIPDKYDTNGNKIQGLEPDPKKAIAYLTKACELSLNPNLWFRLGSIYQNGMYNFEPDLKLAYQLYIKMQEVFPEPKVQMEIQDRITETLTEINNIETHRWLNLTYTKKKNQHHEKIKSLLKKKPGARTTPWLDNGVTVVDRVFRAPDTDVEVLDVNDARFNDRHNTHNSQVVGTVANSLKRIKESTTLNCSAPETIREIRQFLSSKPACDRTTDAMKSLDSIERNIIPITSINMKECDALNIVWNRINSDTHTKNQEDIKDILYQQLADMQEHGKSVCATGRLSRMMDTFSTFDKDVQIKPTYIINKEMMDKAGKMREDMYSAYDEATAKKLREGTANTELQEQFDTKAKNEIINALTKDYVDTGIMTENAFVKNVDEWIDEI